MENEFCKLQHEDDISISSVISEHATLPKMGISHANLAENNNMNPPHVLGEISIFPILACLTQDDHQLVKIIR